jgi:hypothetical protein
MADPTRLPVPWPPRGPWPWWSGPGPSGDGEQIANAFEDFADLTPESQEPAETTRANWAALLPQTAPEEINRGEDD